MQHIFNLNINDCTSQKLTRKILENFCHTFSESGAVRALCGTPSKTLECWPHPYIIDWFKVLTTRPHIPHPAQKRTPVTPNHCQRPWLRASFDYKLLSSIPFMTTLELLSNLDLINQRWIYIWKKTSYFHDRVKWNTYQIFTRKYLTRQHMFSIFINLSM